MSSKDEKIDLLMAMIKKDCSTDSLDFNQMRDWVNALMSIVVVFCNKMGTKQTMKEYFEHIIIKAHQNWNKL